MPGKNPTKKELAERIKQLEERLRELRGAPGPSSGQTGGIAEGIVSTLGKMVPGLEKLIDVASQMPEFHDRLAAIDEEVKRKFKDQPLRRASAGIAGNVSGRQMGIPPSVRRGQSRGSGSARIGRGQTAGKPAARGKYPEPRPPQVHISPETPAQLPVDVFDEGSAIIVLAEAPGLNLEDITVSLEGTVLLVSIEAPHRKGVQRVELPCQVTGSPKTSLANGILNIRLEKASRQ